MVLYKKLVSNFSAYNRFEKGLSEKTIYSYKLHLYEFSKFLGIKACQIENIQPEDILAFMEYLFKKGLSARTVASYTSVLRMFFNFLLIENIIPSNPAKNIQLPSYGIRLPEVLTEEELCILMDLE